jgi:hypothetical protein
MGLAPSQSARRPSASARRGEQAMRGHRRGAATPQTPAHRLQRGPSEYSDALLDRQQSWMDPTVACTEIWLLPGFAHCGADEGTLSRQKPLWGLHNPI